jgi:tetratricopeptide (TPR) repeat protein
VFLDLLAEEGIFSFVFFLAILAYIFYLSVKLFFNKNSKEKNWIGFWGIWFVLGYCLQYFFMYPVISAYVIIFFVFSQVAYAALIDRKEIDETNPKPISQKTQIISVAPAVILFIFIFCFGMLPRLKANYYYTNSVKQPQKAEFLLQKAYETWPSPYFRTNLASYYMRSAFANLNNNSKIVDLYLAKAKGLFLKELKVFPENYLCYANLGSIYNLYSDFQNSDKNFQQAVMISPRHDLYWTWADNVHMRKEFEKAAVLYKKAIELDPEVALPYYKLSLYLKKIGQNDQAQKYFETAVEKGLEDWQLEIKTSTDLIQSSADKTASP